MPLIKLPYRFHHHGRLPLCEVIVLGRSKRIPVLAVVDSGATQPIFPESAARDAQIDLDAARPTMITFGGSTTVGRELDVYVEISGHRMRIPITFVEDIKLGYALLGRKGVFGQFNEVAFIERSGSPRVELRS